jgi:SAM-dependent methyltransferase
MNVYENFNLSDVEGWLRPEEAQWLYERALKSKRILEIGCFQGRSTISMLAAFPAGPHSMVVIDTFDARSTSRMGEFAGDEHALFEKLVWNIKSKGLPLPLVICGESKQARLFSPQFDFIFIDGAHDEEAVRDDLETARRVALPGCIVAVHDYGDIGREGLTAAVHDFFSPDLPHQDAGSIAWGRI